MIQINGTIKLAVGTLDQAHVALVKMAQQSQQEEGCINYTFAQDLTDPETLILYERWRDQAALAAHMKSAHMADFQQAMAKFGQPERDIRMYETDDGQPL